MTQAIVVLVTAPSADKAAELARTLVDERLAACGNIVSNIRSIYRWEGKVCDDSEVLLVLKTQAELFDALCARVVAMHSYECPEVLRLDVSGGHLPYLSWIGESVRGLTGGA